MKYDNHLFFLGLLITCPPHAFGWSFAHLGVDHPISSGGFCRIRARDRVSLKKVDTPRLRKLFSSVRSGPSDGRSLSASEQARREEERRRQQRAGDVVIGKTSALPDASDFALRPSATEQEYLSQANKVEQIIYKQTERGLEALKTLKIDEAIESCDEVFMLKPNSNLWQAGIAKYYANDFIGAADIFARNAASFEAKFGEAASEERIWRHASELKFLSTASKAERKRIEKSGGVSSILTPIPETEGTAQLLQSERRKVVRIVRDLFSSCVDNDYSGLILSEAKLRAIVGPLSRQGSSAGRPMADRKMWKLTAWFYLGLYYDAIGCLEKSKDCMKMALRLCPYSGSSSDIMHALPFLHMSQRDWFDDTKYLPEAEATEEGGVSSGTGMLSAGHDMLDDTLAVDPHIEEAIRLGVKELRTPVLQRELWRRGLTSQGPKDELMQRLFESLMNDASKLR